MMLQQRAKIQWLKGGDQCSRVFFRKVATRRASKRVFQIMDEEGRTHTSKEDVVNEFVSFYRRLLGGERRREFIDLRYLRPWVRHVITQEEASALIQRFHGRKSNWPSLILKRIKLQVQTGIHLDSTKLLGRS
ncbi:UNVERIFIED_CONTAM: hypothetical protein Slati_0862400 [Sesamum latifolium]|uniref:Uncharacterized protein n=1 Tax=Sesamum latifolium TaxID=2727402 RepID=A0AAW2XM69_9LAMI